MSNIKRQERRLRYKSLGLCTECGMPVALGRTKCEKHLASHNKDAKKASLKYIADGKCYCGREKTSFMYRCDICEEKHKIQTKDLSRRRKENGLCIRCGKPLLERTDVTKCINCMEGCITFNWK